MAEQKNQKPFILEIDEAKSELVQSINNIIQAHKLPFYIIDMVLLDVCTQIKEGARNEIAMAKQQVEAQQSEGVA